MDYRRDIDGLRAIAVLAVVLFHAKVPGFPGGFVGVDVFFVISGFLITGLIAADVGAGRFSFAAFYHRRIRRIVPALTLVYLVTAVAAALILLPSDMAEFGRSLLNSALFVSNIFFYRLAGYFDGPSELKPLLHTWSLSIEEQFYLLWPALALLGLSRRPRLLLPAVLAGGLLSAVAYLIALRVQKEAAFFLTPFRVWELMLGAALALRPAAQALPGRSAGPLAWTGLALIALSIAAPGAEHPLGMLAVLPACAGAALLIDAGAVRPPAGRPIPRVTCWLSSRPAVAIGLISYSLYLWHWPLLALARTALDRPLRPEETLLLLAASFGAAAVTYRFVERPARRIGLAHLKPVLGAGLAALGLMALAGQQISRFGGVTFNLDPEIRRLDATARAENPYRDACEGPKNAFRTDAVCDFGKPRTADSGYDLVILGDSHANHYVPTVGALARAAGLTGRQITVGGCLALIGYDEIVSPFASRARCQALREAMLGFIDRNPNLRLVVLAHRWSVYAGASHSIDETAPPFYVLARPDDVRSPERSREVLRDSLAQTLDALAARHIQVLLLGEVPPLTVDPTRCIAKAIKHKRTGPRCGRPAAEVRRILQGANALLADAAAGRGNVSFQSPLETMCTADWCAATVDGVYMYRDSNHLNRYGAELLARSIRLPIGPRVP